MDVFSDLVEAVQSDLTIGADSSLFDLTTAKLAINRAYLKIAGMFKWVETRDALKTSSQNGHEYYEYPDNWRTDSIWKLTVAGKDYGDPLAFADYQYELENNLPSGLTVMWANHNRKYFLFPVPVTTGDNDISIWGYRSVDELVGDSDPTIFSYTMPEVNEAIVMEADAILKFKGEVMQMIRRLYITGSDLLNTEAQQIVATAWTKVSQEQAKIARTTPIFNVPDMFASGLKNTNMLKNKIGNF